MAAARRSKVAVSSAMSVAARSRRRLCAHAGHLPAATRIATALGALTAGASGAAAQTLVTQTTNGGAVIVAPQPLSSIDHSTALVTPTGGLQTTLAVVAAQAAAAVAKSGATMTGPLVLVAPSGTDNSATAVSSAWVRTWVGSLNVATLSGSTVPCSELSLGSNLTCAGNTLSATGGSTANYAGSNGIAVSGATISPTYGTAANTIAQGNDSRIVGAAQGVVGTAAGTIGLIGTGQGSVPALGAGGVLPASVMPANYANTVSLAASALQSIPSNVLTTAIEGTVAGDVAQLGSGGLFGCALLPIDNSTVTCSGGKLVSTNSTSSGTVASTAVVTATGGTTARTLAAAAADAVNVESYGAVPDATTLATANYTIPAGGSGGETLASTVNVFGTVQVGKTIVVPGAGAPGILAATISSFTDSQHVVLSTAANAALSGVAEAATEDRDNFLNASFTIAAGGTTLAASSAVFTASMVGKSIYVPAAGAATGLVSTISGYTDAQHVTLARAATTALSGVSEAPEVGTDDTAAFNNAIAAAVARYGMQGYIVGSVYVPDGTYMVTSVNVTNMPHAGLKIFGQGNLLGVGAGQATVDMLGSAYVRWDGVGVIGDQYAQPAEGMLLGRTGPASSNSSDNNRISNTLISGFHTLTPLLDEQSETSVFMADYFYGNSATDLGPIMDGYHHFPANSIYATNGEAVDQANSFNESLFMECIFQGNVALWYGNTHKLEVLDSYGIDYGSGPAIYDYEEPNADSELTTLDIHVESGGTPITDSVFITGTNNGPGDEGFKFQDQSDYASSAILGVDTGITASMVNGMIDVASLTGSKLVDNPSQWSQMTGNLSLPNSSVFNLTGGPTGNFQGTVQSPNAGMTLYSTVSTASVQGALLNAVGLQVGSAVGSVLLTSGGNYYTNTSSGYTPTLTFSAAPSGGTTAAAHVSSLLMAGLPSASGGTGCTSGAATLADGSGNAITGVATTITASGGAVTGYTYPTGSFASIPKQPIEIVQSGCTGAAISYGVFYIAATAIDTAGNYPAGMPSVTVSGGAPTAAGVAVPSLVTMAAFTRTTPVKTAQLPACSSSTEAIFAAVTDATTAASGGTLASGGSNHVPVYCNGTSWTVR